MTEEQKTIDMTTWSDDEYLCVDSEVGEELFDGYMAETLFEEQRQAFEAHLPFCEKCQRELEYARWALRRLADRPFSEIPLPTIELLDDFEHNLLLDYDDDPMFGRMAASGHAVKPLEFPLTMTYANGTIRVRGEFWRRGNFLTYRLRECQPDQAYTLSYTLPDSGVTQAVALRKDEEVVVCAIEDLVETNEPRQFLQAIKEMRLLVSEKM